MAAPTSMDVNQHEAVQEEVAQDYFCNFFGFALLMLDWESRE